ncbi:MAG: nucleotidyltransferase domain-containing protein [Candidatus Omnitrophica bacterium]|nr:nucleotidyltransferase domain-containing protein [Candidatus Omnitrophota bacterium]
MKPLTKNRAELLRLFFTNPEKSFYMQEVGRILGKKPGVFQRTINNLVCEGVLNSEHKANARYFKVNKSYPLYKELKSITFKTVGVEASLRAKLEELKGIKVAFIYGSYAKGKENYLSDIDLMIIGNPDESQLIKKLDKLEEKLQREINYKFYKLKEFAQEIKEEEPFILGILKEKKIMLIGDKGELRKISKR